MEGLSLVIGLVKLFFVLKVCFADRERINRYKKTRFRGLFCHLKRFSNKLNYEFAIAARFLAIRF